MPQVRVRVLVLGSPFSESLGSVGDAPGSYRTTKTRRPGRGAGDRIEPTVRTFGAMSHAARQNLSILPRHAPRGHEAGFGLFLRGRDVLLLLRGHLARELAGLGGDGLDSLE